MLNEEVFETRMVKRDFTEMASPDKMNDEKPDSCVESWQGMKSTLEDRHVDAVELKGIGWLWGLYDGHGGTRCPEFVQRTLHRYVIDEGNVAFPRCGSHTPLFHHCVVTSL